MLVWTICGLVAGFLLQVTFERLFHSPYITQFLRLSSLAVRDGAVWTLFTFPFLDDSVFSVLFNCLSIYFLGREVLPYLGEKRFGLFMLGAALLAGLFWFGVHYNRPGGLMGATALSMALLALFACYQPNREITLLLFFILPVTVKPKYLAGITGAVCVAGMLAAEIPGGVYDKGIGFSAMVGGMAAGLLYFAIIHRWEWTNPDGRVQIEMPRWLRRSKKSAATEQPKFKVDVSNRADLRAEVDRILDKINSEGFGALTPEEKKLLDDAKDSLSRR